MINILKNLGLPVIDILLVSFVFYKLYNLIKGTRAVQALRGLAILITISFLSQLSQLHTVEWLLSRFWTWGVIAFIILFQPELKQWLAQLGKRGIIPGGSSYYDDKKCVSDIVEVVEKLSNRKVGALIVWQREANLDYYIDSGIPIDSRVSQELILTIFQPHTLLHDGAIIIKEGRIVAASCLLPLSKNPEWKSLGTRHKSAIGLTEETDAIVTIVSEETGSISITINGNIVRNLDIATLDRMLNELLVSKMAKPILES